MDARSLSAREVKVQDMANWMGVLEAYGDVIQQVIARDIPAEKTKQLESLYDVVSAVLIDYKNLVSYIINLKKNKPLDSIIAHTGFTNLCFLSVQLQPLHCDCEVDCFEVPSVQLTIPEVCPHLAELVVSKLTSDLKHAQRIRSYWLVNQAFADGSGVTTYFSDYIAAKPSEEQWTADHSLTFCQ